MLRILCTYIEPKVNDADHLGVSESFILMEIVSSKDFFSRIYCRVYIYIYIDIYIYIYIYICKQIQITCNCHRWKGQFVGEFHLRQSLTTVIYYNCN